MINKDKEDQCEVFRKMRRLPNPTQRKLATQLGFSLGKVNYCLKALQKKGIEISDPDAPLPVSFSITCHYFPFHCAQIVLNETRKISNHQIN